MGKCCSEIFEDMLYDSLEDEIQDILYDDSLVDEAYDWDPLTMAIEDGYLREGP